MPDLWIKALSGALRCSRADLGLTECGGGDTARAARLDIQGRAPLFVKFHPNADLLVAEARGLALLGPQVPVPAVHSLVPLEGERGALLVMEYLVLSPLRGDQHWFDAGQTLARLHQVQGPYYGETQHNFIGGMPQYNRPETDWPTFFAGQRLAPQLQWARQRGLDPELCRQVEQVIDVLPRWLPGQPSMALLHGDLWQGNLAMHGDQVCFYDPACYYGDPQVDLAMLNLFGRPPQNFYLGYQGHTISAADRRAWPVYDLYHWLNHYNLFGSSYRQAIASVCQTLLSEP
ncbi:fructosamine kinase [Alcanivorax hongdengensis A-11-3]|uniref:Fructosamine kinase n=1 Tax=Alcanivorax hongdengensis A-11-3 TaxID=1177179 RepID=L0WE87_9GAMM|nr:fructosamine kinase family protein [Alcanivorax hongdengensis]EKF75148.1 fructosamine kinase [Alcanivorax hongdengensis A-11-3]